MPRPTTSRSHSKARWRSDSRAPGGSRSHDKPRSESEMSPKAKYAARAKYKAQKRAKEENMRREPVIDLRMAARNAMEQYGLLPEFSLVILAKANSLDESTVERAGAQVRDLRHLLWSSIDNYGTAEFDQIEYCERGQGGEILVKVAIADVDAYVPKGSTLDLHAQTNAISVYTLAETYPMLPAILSCDLSSLPFERDRLAIVVEFAVLPRGNVRPGKIYRAVVRNKAVLAYEEVNAWLEGRGQPPDVLDETQGLEEQIRLQDEASVRLGKCRAGQSAIEPEKREGSALGLYLADDDRAKRIIENFMIGANSVMSGFLEKENIPSIRRVVRTPKYWSEIVNVANAKGFALPPEPDASILSEFLGKQKKADPEGFQNLSLAIAKLLGSGEYDLHDKKNPTEYFCLAVTNYTYGTAPNRRYADLVIQRLLKAALAHTATPYSRGELIELAEWCTDREHVAKKVERFVAKAGAAVQLSGKLGKTFDAVVTGASEKGTFARLIDPPVEGMVTSQGRGLHVGQKVKVKLINLEPAHGFVDLEVVDR